MTQPCAPRSPTTPDPAFERHRWEVSGPSWDKWADPLSGAGAWINNAMLDRLPLAPGARLLDLAAGAGEPAIPAAERMGADGLVVATDLVASMLVGARRRANASPAGRRLVFALADMGSLPFAAGSLDHVTCRLGLMFVPDAAVACAEMARVLRPGGTAVVAVWGSLADNTLFRVLDGVLEAVAGRDPADGLAPLFRFAAPGSLVPLFRQAGFVDAAEEEIRSHVRVPVDRPFWRATLELAFAARLRSLTAELRMAVEQEAERRFHSLAQPHAGSGPAVPLTMSVRLCSARKA